jgi:hypothetical protein
VRKQPLTHRLGRQQSGASPRRALGKCPQWLARTPEVQPIDRHEGGKEGVPLARRARTGRASVPHCRPVARRQHHRDRPKHRACHGGCERQLQDTAHRVSPTCSPSPNPGHTSACRYRARPNGGRGMG